ncbi:hypothetical protein [Vreelandella piezotolerans]|uniref:Uncharacterized protein n=1 Tax=Vreelandella piezotolerans TaxID=2609667 RepID=A0ABQ6XEL8_9GAMM|nr:hypothetical protein [Halomonas piezotolerans]KAE8440077.1 hypothetical protein F1978_02210 [Halomonas piezotolerans]QJA23615.1 hypothetical protein GYM47_05565 [Halomonas piezotolerans]
MAEKVIINMPDTLFPFMPPVWELVGWLDDKCTGMHTLLHRMQEDESLKLTPVHRQTLKKAYRNGVSPRIAEKIERNLHKVAEQKNMADLLSHITPKEPIVRDTNGTKWLVFSQGLLEGINQHQPIQKLELPLTLSFLEKRAKAERQLILTCHQARKMETSPEEKLTRMRKAICEVFRHHTLLNSQEIRSYSTAMIDASRPGQQRTTELVAEALKVLFCLRVDFYHQLLASFMTDMLKIKESLRIPDTLTDALVNHGGMGQLMPFLEGEKLVTPTYRLYELWLGAFSLNSEKPMSYRTMSLHLPTPSITRTRVGDQATLEDIHNAANETRRSRLKEWRTGTAPKIDQLIAFIESLTGESYGAFMPLIMTHVATAWTNWIEQELANLEKQLQEDPSLTVHLNRDWLLARFSSYPDYWAHVKAQAHQR